MRVVIIGNDRTEKIKSIFGTEIIDYRFSVWEKNSKLENIFLQQEENESDCPTLIIRSDSRPVVKPTTLAKMLSKVLEKDFDVFYLFRGSDSRVQAVLFSLNGLEKMRCLLQEKDQSISFSAFLDSQIAKEKITAIYSRPNIIEIISSAELIQEDKEIVKETPKEDFKEEITEPTKKEIIPDPPLPPAPEPPTEVQIPEQEKKTPKMPKRMIDYKSVQVDDYEIDETLKDKLTKTFGTEEIISIAASVIVFFVILAVFRK